MHKLMIVDDSSIIRNKISRCKFADKFEIVCSARSGVEAVKGFTAHHPDIVTMDLTMPHMGGLEAIRTIVAIDASVRILVVSAISDKATGIKALQLGAVGFLRKPFTDDQLFEALRNVMED